MKRTSFLVLVLEDDVGLPRTGQLQLLRHQWSMSWITVLIDYCAVLNCLPWKQTKIILLLLRLHPGTKIIIFKLIPDLSPILRSGKGLTNIRICSGSFNFK